MDFRPTDGQQLLVSAARDVLRRHCPIETSPDGAAPGLDAGALWALLAELGGRACSCRATSAAATAPCST